MVGGRSFDEVVKGLRATKALGRGKAPVSDKASLFHALVGLFRLQPEVVADAGVLIVAQDPLGDLLLDALAMASTRETIQTLGRLALSRELPKKKRQRVALSFIRTPRPTAQSLAIAKQFIADETLYESGLLGVGTFVRLWHEAGEEALAVEGATVLGRELEAARKEPLATARVTALLAIANSGAGLLYDHVLVDQKHPDAKVREAAIQAVRLMDRKEVESLLLGFIRSEDLSDKEASLHAIARRQGVSDGTVQTVKQLALTHETAEIRRQAVLALIAWLSERPSLRATIDKISASDESEKVRRAVRDNLPI